MVSRMGFMDFVGYFTCCCHVLQKKKKVKLTTTVGELLIINENSLNIGITDDLIKTFTK